MPNKTIFDKVTRCYTDEELSALIQSCDNEDNATPEGRLYHESIKALLKAARSFRDQVLVRNSLFRAKKDDEWLKGKLNIVVKAIEPQITKLSELQHNKAETEVHILHSAICYSIDHFNHYMKQMKGERIYELYQQHPLQIPNHQEQ